MFMEEWLQIGRKELIVGIKQVDNVGKKDLRLHQSTACTSNDGVLELPCPGD